MVCVGRFGTKLDSGARDGRTIIIGNLKVGVAVEVGVVGEEGGGEEGVDVGEVDEGGGGEITIITITTTTTKEFDFTRC